MFPLPEPGHSEAEPLSLRPPAKIIIIIIMIIIIIIIKTYYCYYYYYYPLAYIYYSPAKGAAPYIIV